jgi:hypothetical protein
VIKVLKQRCRRNGKEHVDNRSTHSIRKNNKLDKDTSCLTSADTTFSHFAKTVGGKIVGNQE